MASIITKKPKRHEKTLTIMTMVIVLVFAICNSFYGLYYILRSQELITKIQKSYLYPTACVFLVLNSSVNVIIYGIFNKKFRITFVSLFCFCVKQTKTRLSMEQKSRYSASPRLNLSQTRSSDVSVITQFNPPIEKQFSRDPAMLSTIVEMKNRY